MLIFASILLRTAADPKDGVIVVFEKRALDGIFFSEKEYARSARLNRTKVVA